MYEEIQKNKTAIKTDGAQSLSETADSTAPSQQDLAGASKWPDLGPRYKIEALIDEGGMGFVYRAKDTSLNKTVAIKVLKSHLASDPRALRRFEQECTSLVNLDHDNLIAITDHGRARNDSPYLVMDYVEGRSLAQILKDDGIFDPKRATELVVQICNGLSYAHKKGVVHRDLKPSNIIITKDSTAFNAESSEKAIILDFGIARIVESTLGNETSLTKTGDVFGTPTYMSPEQCEGKQADRRCDLYSIGCILHELLSGHPPFEGTNPVQVAVKHINDQARPFLDKSRKKEPFKSLEAISLCCLAKDPRDRYQTVEELLADLNRVRKKKTVKRKEKLSQVLPNWLQLVYAIGIAIPLTTLMSFSLTDTIIANNPAYSDPRYLSDYLRYVGSVLTLLLAAASLTLTYLCERHRIVLKRFSTMRSLFHFVEVSLSTTGSFLLLFVCIFMSTGLIHSPPLDWLSTTLCVASILFLSLFLWVTLIGGIFGPMYKEKMITRPRVLRALLGFVLIPSAFLISSFVIFPKSMVGLPYLYGCITTTPAPHLAQFFLNSATMLDPTFGPAYERMFSLKVLFDPKGKSALNDLDRAIDEYPDSAELWKARGKIRVHSVQYRDPVAAVRDLNLAARKNPEDPEIFYLRSQAQVASGDFSAAEKDATIAIELAPSNASYYRQRVNSLVGQKKYDLALRDFTNILVTSRESSNYEGSADLIRKAVIYQLMGEEKKAQASYQNYIDINGLDDGMLAMAYKCLGNKTKYMEKMQLTREQHPKQTDEEIRKYVSKRLFDIDIPISL